MPPRWAVKRTPAEQRAFELDGLAEEARRLRAIDPATRGHIFAAMLIKGTEVARKSPHWEAMSAPVPRPPEAEARWWRLVAAYRERLLRG